MSVNHFVHKRANPPLSKFGQNAYAELSEFCMHHHGILRDSFHEGNPNGFINIGVAENTLMKEELRDYFERNIHILDVDFTYGDGLIGSSRLCKALSGLLNSHFEPHMPVLPEHLLFGGGLSPILAQVARAVANPGDGILMVSPYYQGFDVLLSFEHGVKVVGVSIPWADLLTMNELRYLERALQESNAQGTTIKAILFCNPHNPLGRCYPRDVIIAYCQFCEKHNLHLLSDEIFALSVFPSNDVPHPQPFISALSLDLDALCVNPSRVHMLYGMSKDFNANGFRVGVLVSQTNTHIIRSLAATTIFMLVGSPADALWSALLNDENFLPLFLKENKLKLREAYEHMTTWLSFHKIPYIPSSAGHFLMVDLRPILMNVDRYGPILPITPEQTMEERELALTDFLFSKKILVTAGSKCHAPEIGWFRFTFAVRRDFVNVALRRIEAALKWDAWVGIPTI